MRLSSPRTAFALIAVTLLGVFAFLRHPPLTEAQSNQEVATYTGAETGKDPHAYKTAEDMYRCAPASDMDAAATGLIREITEKVAAGTDFASPVMHKLLLALNPYRKTEQVQANIAEWVERSADFARKKAEAPQAETASQNVQPGATAQQSALKKSPVPEASTGKSTKQDQTKKKAVNNPRREGLIQPPRSPGAASREQGEPNRKLDSELENGNRLYREGKFAEAIVRLGNALAVSPLHLDARNNLGLAEMRMGNDLAAQIQFLLLRTLKPSYIPAMVNLSVVYERLGRTSDAEQLSMEALKAKSGALAASFNAAWYHSVNGRLNEAKKLLSPVVDMGVSPKHQELLNLVKKQKQSLAQETVERRWQDSLWSTGISGMHGGKGGRMGWGVAIALFLAGAALLVRIVRGFTRVPGPARMIFAALGAPWYVLYWGLPTGPWWLMLIAFSTVGAFMSSRR